MKSKAYRIRTVDDHEATTRTKEIWLANGLEVEAGTNGLHGGDGGHGSRAYIRITDLGGSDIRFVRESEKSLIMEICGDSEIQSIICAMRFVADHLSDQIKELKVKDHEQIKE